MQGYDSGLFARWLCSVRPAAKVGLKKRNHACKARARRMLYELVSTALLLIFVSGFDFHMFQLHRHRMSACQIG